ncbi:MAG: RDD family protein [Acidobacteriota bacterium]
MVTRRCPCGYETRASFRTGSKQPPAEEPVITAEFYNSASESETARWRYQLERKFELAREKLPDMVEAERLVDDIFLPDIPGLVASEATRVSSPPEAAAPDTAAGTVDAESRDVGPDSAFLKRPAQQALSLEPLVERVATSKARPEKEARPAVSKEILFSRVLAGILDLLLPVATAMVFVFAACWFLNLDFFSPSATHSWFFLALSFYFLNSLYFFWTAGRTPGMSATDLELSGEDSEDPPFVSVVIRIVLFLPVVATVLGLIPALFDSECRALHDRLSKTKIVAS